MKRAIAAFLICAMLVLSASAVVFAGGDKVRGDNGQGSVNQHQEQDPPPFN